MAQLKSGSTVGGNSILTTASSVGFPAGTVMVFYQASAPTGWTQSIAQNNKALRVVSGAGGGTGGTHAFSSPPSTSHTHSTPSHSHTHTLSAGAHTLSTAQMPSHNHSFTYGGEGGSFLSAAGISRTSAYSSSNYTLYSGGGHGMGNTGGGGSHSHSLAGSITSGGSGTSGAGGTGATGSAGPTAFAPQYIDVIVCSKN